ncbi:unnamed protein product [Zymoseptoria tritici ST99CH_3D7]|uniref:Uncharacterized protein n=1 Tax=Zymoseptoria tritici (strain ST99CH_3D7) TaxID=1276538 RepID=A0A1X7SA30_ZYMT9|nr:unnamed protein product [Zymoseptoria tritici ST99CH_3D7]
MLFIAYLHLLTSLRANHPISCPELPTRAVQTIEPRVCERHRPGTAGEAEESKESSAQVKKIRHVTGRRGGGRRSGASGWIKCSSLASASPSKAVLWDGQEYSLLAPSIPGQYVTISRTRMNASATHAHLTAYDDLHH